MPNRGTKPGAIHLRIVEVMKRFPEGVSGGQISQKLRAEVIHAAHARCQMCGGTIIRRIVPWSEELLLYMSYLFKGRQKRRYFVLSKLLTIGV